MATRLASACIGLICALLLSLNASDAQQESTDPVRTCMAAQPTDPSTHKKHRPVSLLFKGLASEAGTDLSAFMKDSIFVFSAKAVDPYAKEASSDRPYTAAEIRFVDGSSARLIKFPDGSSKIEGGYADGTIIAPNGKDTYIIAYPNGVRGKVVESAGQYQIFRPDNTVTTVKRTMSGDYSIDNNKLGYLGTARPDNEGMQYEFRSKDF